MSTHDNIPLVGRGGIQFILLADRKLRPLGKQELARSSSGGRMGAQGPLGPQPSCLFPLIDLLSLAAWSFPSASVELDLADKLTMIYGPGSPREAYSGATMNIQLKGNGYIWKPGETSIWGRAVCHSVPACPLSAVIICHKPVIIREDAG